MWTLGPNWDLFAHHSLLWSWRLVLILQARVACRLAVPHTFAPFDKRHSAGRRAKAANGLPTYHYHQNWENFIPLHVDGVLSSPDFLCHLITALPVWCNLRDILAIHTWAMPKYLKVLYRRLQESILPWWQTHTQDWNCANDVSYMITAGNERIR